MKILPHRFVTQIEYRGEGKKIILGWIGDFRNRGITNTDKYGIRYLNFKSSTTGRGWSHTWTSYNGAIAQLLVKHGKDPIQGGNRVVPVPETWASTWKPLDFCEDYDPNELLTHNE